MDELLVGMERFRGSLMDIGTIYCHDGHSLSLVAYTTFNVAKKQRSNHE